MKTKHFCLAYLATALLLCLVLKAGVHAQTPEEFFAMEAGNFWNYNGNCGAFCSYSLQDLVGIDATTPSFPFRLTKTTGGQIQLDFEWYLVSPTDLKLWKVQFFDDVDGTVIIQFSSGITWARNPMFVGDTWNSFSVGTYTSLATGAIPITVSVSSVVEAQEAVTVPQGIHRAYRIRHNLNMPGLAAFTTVQWAVPYLGIIKRQDIDTEGTDTEDLASSNVTLPAGMTFLDVNNSHFARMFIEQLSTSGITGGCLGGPPPDYCPEESITRGQMAVFIESSLGHPANVCTGRFTDVPLSNPFCGFIERMADDGITGGCGTNLFCPNSPVTRGQMSVFIEAALGHTSTTCTGQFSDVPVGHSFCRFIEHLAADEITGGCGGGNYCPDAPVTRAQMAVFLVAAPPPLNP